jgi:calcyclin binding protein
MKVKSNSIVLELKKANEKYWSDVKEKKDATKSNLKKKGVDDESGSNPEASLMGMMKEMYENGDDNIKRTIAESWEKARKEKGANIL